MLNFNKKDTNKDNEQPPLPEKGKMIKKPSQVTLWLILILMALFVYQLMYSTKTRTKDIAYSDFVKLVNTDQVSKAVFEDKDIKFELIDKKIYHTYMPFEDANIVNVLQAKNVNVVSQRPSKVLTAILSWLPFLLFIGIWIFFMRSMSSGGNKAFTFGKSRAKMFMDGKTNTTFNDVAGVDEAKEELEEIVEFLKAPQKFQKLGGRIPRGVLLLGRPGTGKTLLAKAVAGEAGVPFFSISGSDFVEMFVGVGASRVRDLFEQAKKSAPCIAFIDEIDAVGRSRGAGLGGGHDEREQTLNQLLVEMDGFEKNDSVIIIAATNRPDVLDPALLRPGRFDRQVVVDLPDIKGREAILKVHTKVLPMADDVNLSIIARSTPGFSGADLANLVNESALLAAAKDKNVINMIDFDEAKDKVTLGKERKSKVIADEDKRNTAFHEVGHVLCSVFQEKTEPVHKVTIIPRGFSGGATHFLQTDKSNYSRTYLEQTLVSLLGGRAAEEVTFGDLTTGAGSDIQRATEIAKKMVTQWGMSLKVGPMTVGKEEGQIFLGKDFAQRDFFSEDTARMVDNEIREIIQIAHTKAMSILKDHKQMLETMAIELLEKETLGTNEIYDMILKDLDENEREFVEARYKKALEMKIELT